MGLIADALRANLRNLAESDARSLRELDQELIRSRNGAETSAPPSLQAGVDPKALLGEGRFEQQTVARLKQLCRTLKENRHHPATTTPGELQQKGVDRTSAAADGNCRLTGGES